MEPDCVSLDAIPFRPRRRCCPVALRPTQGQRLDEPPPYPLLLRSGIMAEAVADPTPDCRAKAERVDGGARVELRAISGTSRTVHWQRQTLCVRTASTG